MKSIYYRTLELIVLPVNNPDKFIQTMQKVFGESLILSHENIRELIVLSLVDLFEKETYKEIVDAIEQHGTIEIGAE